MLQLSMELEMEIILYLELHCHICRGLVCLLLDIEIDKYIMVDFFGQELA